MAWYRPGDKPLSEPMLANPLVHLCLCVCVRVCLSGLSGLSVCLSVSLSFSLSTKDSTTHNNKNPSGRDYVQLGSYYTDVYSQRLIDSITFGNGLVILIQYQNQYWLGRLMSCSAIWQQRFTYPLSCLQTLCVGMTLLPMKWPPVSWQSGLVLFHYDHELRDTRKLTTNGALKWH